MPTTAQRRAQARLQRQLAAAVAEVDFALLGSITQRMTVCGTPTCRCHADPPQLHGPSWQWTRKVAGRTVTRRLTADQAQRYEIWIDNARRLRDLLHQLETLSVQAAEADLQD